MQILVAPIENYILTEKAKFSADEAANQTVLSCDNAAHFAVNDYIILGNIGSETVEIRKISSISSDLTTITVSEAINFSHDEGSPIIKILFNQRKFYRSSTETGTYTHLSSEGSPVDIQVDQPDGTDFEDSSGTSSSWYKATYYNSTTGEETSLDDSIAVKAGDTEHYTSVYKIKNEAGFENNDYISSEIISRYREEAEAQAEGSVVSKYQLPFSSDPKIFQHIVTLLAAGLLLSKEYGLESDVEISKTGQRKIERAEELLEKIANGTLSLIGSDGNELSRRTDVLASCSNVYDSTIDDKGELFNISDEHFKMTDPDDPLADSRRSTSTDIGFS